MDRVTTGGPNAALSAARPMCLQPSFGAFGTTRGQESVNSIARCNPKVSSRATRAMLPVRKTRVEGQHAMVRNDRLPEIEISPQTVAVTVSAVTVSSVHAKVTPAMSVLPNRFHDFG
jgi:urease subunit alpha